MQYSILRLISLVIVLPGMVSAMFIRIPRSPKGGAGGVGGGHGSSDGGAHGTSDTTGRSTTTSGAGRGGSGDTGYAAVSYGAINTRGRDANFFGGGGGKPITLPSTSAFGGRLMGGGTRSQVLGTRSYGSGYPYSNGDISRSGVSGQPFPFGFWPIYWSGHGHSDEYGNNETVASQRPGGDQVMVELIPNINATVWNTTAVNGINETYWMIGDRDSVTALFGVLMDVHGLYAYGCSVENQTINPFNFSDSSSSPVHFENVIQYYRSSSFALAYQGYNNTYGLNDTAGLGWNNSTPLPTEQVYSPFLQCINTTITAALPILDQRQPRLDGADIAGIVIGSIFAALFVLCCIHPCIMSCHRSRKDRKKAKAEAKRTRRAPVNSYAPDYSYFSSATYRSIDSPYSIPASFPKVADIRASEKEKGSNSSASSSTLVAPPRAHLKTNLY